MSEEIVACPGCAKKFRIPDGAAPNGAFDCTACGAAVKYGSKPAAGPGGRSKRAGGARGRAKAAARKGGGTRGGKGGRAAAGGRKRGKGRSRRGEEAPEQPVQKGPPLIVPILCGVVVLILAVVIVMNMKKPKKGADTASVATGTVTTGGLTADPNAGAEPEPEPEPAKDPEPITTQPAADPEPEVGGDSGIGGKDVEEKPKEKDERYYWYLDDSQLFIVHESTPETTAEERTEIDRLVVLMGDMASAKDGMRATDDIIEKWGKKAFPSMLTTFKGKSFDTQEEQFSAYQMQLAMRAIVKADLPRNKDFIARFTPQMTVPKEHFKSAAKMWICHWLGNLQDKEEFAEFEEEEE